MRYLLRPFVAFSAFVLFTIFAIVPNVSAQSVAGITEFDVNGLKVILKKRESFPTVSAGLFVRGGVRNQKPEQAGIEMMTLAVAAEGSTKFPRNVLRRELSKTGSIISGSSGYDFGVMSMTSTRPHFDRTWEIFTDLFRNPTITQADLDQVRDQTVTGLKNRGVSPDDALNEFEARILYAGHPYAIEPTGSIETIESLKAADLRAYHKTLLQTSRLLLVIVGDIDPAVFKRQVESSFGKLPKGNYKEPELSKLKFERPTLDISERKLPTNYVKGVFAAPSLADPDYYAMRVAMTILQSRVYQEVRVRRNLSYAPNAEMDNSAANSANIYVTAVDANQSVSVMLGEIEAMKRELIDAGQFEGIPGYFLTTYYLQQETNAAQVAELARYELYGGGWRRSLEFLEGIKKVTPEDVRTVANKYFKNIRFFVVGDPAAVSRPTFIGG